jgi:hypothetical protein
MNNYENQVSQQNSAKAVKQSSVIENEIDSLGSEVAKINRLTDSISCMLRSPQPSCEGAGDKPPQAKTIAGELNSILAIAEETRVQLESIGKLLESQLGSLKLEG